MLILVGLLIIVTGIIIGVLAIKLKNTEMPSNDQIKDLKRRIDELDNDNVDVTENGKGKVVVPDSVDVDDATEKSTQKEDCKEYMVRPKQKVEKVVIKSEQNNDDLNDNDEDNKGPIKNL